MKKIVLIINLKTLLITLLSIATTWLCIRFGVMADFPLTLVATAVVFPIVFSINEAYKRREAALGRYAILKAHGKVIYLAARDWLQPANAETVQHCRQQLQQFFVACKTLFTSQHADSRKHEEAVYRAFSDLSRFIQTDLRDKGLPSSEVSRCNQYLSKMVGAFEDAKHIYQYRTPRTLRTFSTIFISLLPIVYGPYFAFQASAYSPYVTYVLPVLFSCILVGLSNIQDQLENPFDGVGEDDISINIELFMARLYD